jgi:hypothetical protein
MGEPGKENKARHHPTNNQHWLGFYQYESQGSKESPNYVLIGLTKEIRQMK